MHSDHQPRYRSSAMDRAVAPTRIVCAVGPVADLDETRVRANLQAAERASQTPRLALDPRPDALHWRYRTGIAEASVWRRDDLSTDDLGRLVATIRNRREPRGPLEVLICGDYLVVDLSHGVGDGQMGLMLMAVLAGEISPEAAATLAVGLPENAARRAVWQHYSAHPRALVDAWRLRAAHKAPPPGPAGLRHIDHWRRHKNSVSAFMEPAAVARLRDWAKTNAAGSTTASVTVALWLAALHSVGVRLDPRVMVLMNCRRYLGPDYLMAHGNFAVGLPLLMPARATAPRIAATVRDVIDSGWPLAVLQVAELKAALRRGVPVGGATGADVPDRIRLSVSDLGRLSMFDNVRWSSNRPPQVAAFLEPDGADAVTMLVSELAGGRTFTVSFCDQMIAPSIIDEALAEMCNAPVKTLLRVS